MKFWKHPNLLAILFLVILSVPALKSLTTPGFYTSHDGETHTDRIAAYYQSLLDGQIPPRWAQTFYMGLGSPIFVYIYPLPYLFGSAVHAVGFSFADSFKILMGLSFILSGVFFYLWLNEVFKSQKAAFLGALFYMWAPYRFSLIYVRASISELLAYVFLPLVFYSLTKLKEKQSLLWISAGAIFFAGVLLSQNLVALISAPVIGAYILILAFYSKSFKYLAKSILSLVWGFAIAQVTYMPTLFEMKFVHFEEIIKTAYDNHFVTLGQIIHSPWGYGFDLPGTANDGMSFQVGLAHILVLILATLLIIFFLLQRFNFAKKWGRGFIANTSPQLLVLSLLFLVSLFLSIFLMLDIHSTRIVWQNLKLGNYIDIPWRLLGLSTLALSFLAAFVAKNLKPGLIFLFLVLFVLAANHSHLRINKAQILDDNFFKNYTGHATQYGEFTPKWRQTTRVPIDTDPRIKAEVITGQAKISSVSSNSKTLSFETTVLSSNAQIKIDRFYFPGTSVTLDGTKLTPFKDLTITDPTNLHLEKEQDSSGLMLVKANMGSHKVSVNFGETPLRLFADLLSLAAFSFALFIIAKNAKK